MASWKVLNHPADLAIEGRGGTPQAAYTAVVEGLLAELGPVPERPGTPVEIVVEGLDQEECLVSALNELLYRSNVRGEWFGAPRVLELGETRLRLRVGSAPRPERCPLETEVKAATYHQLRLVPHADGSWQLTVVFDV